MSRGGVPDFDRLARVYRWLEYLSFGPSLWRCRTEFLSKVSGCRHALVLGDGDGRFTARLLRAHPGIRVHAIDVSPAMIAALRREAGEHGGRLVAEVADARWWTRRASESPFDLVATHFFLDCLTSAEVVELTRRLGPAVAPDAAWLISEFAVPPTAFGRAIAARLVALLYCAFGLLTGLRVRSLPDYARALTAAGWRRKAESVRLGGLLVSQLWVRGFQARRLSIHGRSGLE